MLHYQTEKENIFSLLVAKYYIVYWHSLQTLKKINLQYQTILLFQN